MKFRVQLENSIHMKSKKTCSEIEEQAARFLPILNFPDSNLRPETECMARDFYGFTQPPGNMPGWSSHYVRTTALDSLSSNSIIILHSLPHWQIVT
jgi:hypothetical protein